VLFKSKTSFSLSCKGRRTF